MMNGITWQRLSVRDCFAGFAWQGPGSVVQSPRRLARSGSWQTSRVAEFFGQYNWSGEAKATIAIARQSNDTGFSVRLPVKQFFSCFTWGGQPQIAPQPTPVPSPNADASADIDFKLANFSNLF